MDNSATPSLAAGFAAAFKSMINDIGGENSANTAVTEGNLAKLEIHKVDRIIVAGIIGGTASVISGGKFANGALSGALTQMYNGEEANEKNTVIKSVNMEKRLKVTEVQRKLLADGKMQEFWESRLRAGDPVAKAGLASLNPKDNLLDYLFGGTSINNRLQSFANIYNEGKLDIQQVRIDLAKAHVLAVDGDTRGIRGLLSPEQIAIYHHDVFAAHGLPPTTFGGTPFTGSSDGFYPHRAIWCWGCDWN